MKGFVIALALVAGASQAQAKQPAFPLWACKMKAKVVQTNAHVELLIARGEEVLATGTVICSTALGQTKRSNVMVKLNSIGFGPAINGPLEGLTIYAVRAGIATTDGMNGTYQLQAGPRLGLLTHRVGVVGGVQISGAGAGAGVEAIIENRFALGVDIGGMLMEVTEAPARRLKARR